MRCICLLLVAACTPTKTITLLHTTDLHANVVAWDYLAAKPDPARGLAKAATVIRERRTACTLVIDTGDTLQGAPLPPEAMAPAMNAVGYAAMAVGNHDFNFGLPVLRAFMDAAKFPVLAANVTGFNAFAIEETCGVRVGILGLVTPRVDTWERPDHIRGLTFASLLETARSVVPQMRAAGAQIVVIAMHSGLSGGLPGENEAAAIADQVSGVDVILTGHTHVKIPKRVINGVVISQPHRWGSHVGETILTWKGEVIAKDSHLLPVDAAPEAPEVMRAVDAWHQKTLREMAKPVGSTTAAFVGGDVGRFQDFALAELINAAQMEASGAPVSLAAVFSDAGLPKGPLTYRDVNAIYMYENTLWVVELTREQLRAALEKNAEYDPKHSDDYDWDLYAGIDYRIDFTKPVGQRVTLQAPERVRVAMNNYRAGSAPFKEGKVIWQSQETVRDLLVAYIRRHSPITPVGSRRIALVLR